MATLIERLHDEAGSNVSSYSPRDHVTLEAGLLVEAADRIDQLEREAENMRRRLNLWEPSLTCPPSVSSVQADYRKAVRAFNEPPAQKEKIGALEAHGWSDETAEYLFMGDDVEVFPYRKWFWLWFGPRPHRRPMTLAEQRKHRPDRQSKGEG